MFDIFRNLISKRKKRAISPHSRISYAQEAEDLILDEYFQRRSSGFFVDVGAYHPCRFSNTYFFYEKGWRGINIEPSPDAAEIFQTERPLDINLNLGVSDRKGELKLFKFNEQALNTFDEARAMKLEETTPFRVIGHQQIQVDTLESILATHAPGRPIDFMNIDVECHEIEVLRSNNWNAFRAKMLLIEILDFNFKTLGDNEIHRFLENVDYKFECKTPRTCFYSDLRK